LPAPQVGGPAHCHPHICRRKPGIRTHPRFLRCVGQSIRGLFRLRRNSIASSCFCQMSFVVIYWPFVASTPKGLILPYPATFQMSRNEAHGNYPPPSRRRWMRSTRNTRWSPRRWQ
jgi:hypothetical protein